MPTDRRATGLIWLGAISFAVLNLSLITARAAVAEPANCPETTQSCNAETTANCSIPGYPACDICWPKLFNPSQGTCISYN